jgi:hypothetical protein
MATGPTMSVQKWFSRQRLNKIHLTSWQFRILVGSQLLLELQVDRKFVNKTIITT